MFSLDCIWRRSLWYALSCRQGDQNSAFPLGDFSLLSLSVRAFFFFLLSVVSLHLLSLTFPSLQFRLFPSFFLSFLFLLVFDYGDTHRGMKIKRKDEIKIPSIKGLIMSNGHSRL